MAKKEAEELEKKEAEELEKKEAEELEKKEAEELVSLDALRTCATVTKGEVLGKFQISKEDLEKDSKIQRFIEIGFIVEA